MNPNILSIRPLLLSLMGLPILASLNSCKVGPDYARPETAAQLPAAYDMPSGWKVAEPSDDKLSGEWWKRFGDPELNRLMDQALANNQEVKAAFARVEQARAISGVARSAWFPMFNLEPEYQRYETSSTTSTSQFNTGRTASTLSIPLQMQYEIDLWGRLRRAIEAAEAETLASEANLRQVLLALQAELASNYFSMRSLDAEIATFRDAIGLRQQFLDLNNMRFEAGDTDEVDVARAETELAATEAELSSLKRSRSDLEDAIAVLAGVPSSGFKVKADPLTGRPPKIPVSVPSELLERRPDVASAERVMAAENARIGVAKAAFYPAVRLTGSLGFESSESSRLFDIASRTWGFGPQISVPIFEGGLNKAQLRQAEARYDETVADYRQTVLQAVSEVDQALTGVQLLQEQADAQRRTVEAARRTVELSKNRYDAGLVAYFEVVDSQRTLLDAEQQAARVAGARYLAAISLVRALGGGWEE